MSEWIKKLTEAYSEVNMNENKQMANAKALAKATASSEKGKAAVTLPKAPFDIPKKAEKMPIPKKDVNELNKSTLGSYIKKAAKDGQSKKQDVDIFKRMGDDKEAAKHAQIAKNRTAGINRAADKLAKEAMDPVNHKALKGKHKDRDDTDIDNDGDTDSSDKYLHKRRKAISKNIKGGDEVEMNPKKKKDKGAATANADAEMAESTLPSVYARILENRAAHYKKAAPAQDKEDGMAPMTKKAKADMEAGAKMDDTEEKGHVDAAKAGRAGPGRKPRRNDNMKGDKSVIPSATKMKEAFDAVYEHVKPLKGVDHDTIKHSNSEHGDHMDIGHGAHEIEHPEEGGRGSSSPSHSHAYAYHDKKTGKVSAIQIKHQKTNPAAVAKGFGHKEVTNAHRAIADIHNGINTPDVKGGPKGAASMGHQDYDKHGNNTDLAK